MESTVEPALECAELQEDLWINPFKTPQPHSIAVNTETQEDVALDSTVEPTDKCAMELADQPTDECAEPPKEIAECAEPAKDCVKEVQQAQEPTFAEACFGNDAYVCLHVFETICTADSQNSGPCGWSIHASTIIIQSCTHNYRNHVSIGEHRSAYIDVQPYKNLKTTCPNTPKPNKTNNTRHHSNTPIAKPANNTKSTDAVSVQVTATTGAKADKATCCRVPGQGLRGSEHLTWALSLQGCVMKLYRFSSIELRIRGTGTLVQQQRS